MTAWSAFINYTPYGWKHSATARLPRRARAPCTHALLPQMNRLLQPVKADEEARAQALQAEAQFRSIAIMNYKRCLQVRGLGVWGCNPRCG